MPSSPTTTKTTIPIDASRYFPNPYGTGVETVRLTREECLQKAFSLFRQCQNYYHTTNSQTPPGSLYQGALGTLVFLPWKWAAVHRQLGHTTKSNQLLREARQCVDRLSHRSGRVTLLESPWVGARALQIAVLHDLGETTEATTAARDLAEQLRQACRALPPAECDVLYGRAGALHALLFVRRVLLNAAMGHEVVLQLAEEIVNEGRRYAERHPHCGLPLLWKWHDTKYLGAAHGVVGILHTLLCLEPNELTILDERHGIHRAIKESIQGLERHCWPSGNLDSSVKPKHGVDRLVHWCHGATGHILLLMRAHEIYGDENYQRHAIQLARNVVWPRGLLKKGAGLCHGISGSAYALLAASRNDDSLVDCAHAFVRFALDNLDQLQVVPDQPFSLYNGVAGLCTLLIDLLDEDSPPRFPLYDHC